MCSLRRRLRFAYIPARSFSILHIVVVSAKIEMSGPHTAFIVTAMADKQTAKIFDAVGEHIRDLVSGSSFPA